MPKLKDKIYGEMNWEQWEEDFGFWFSRMKDEENEDFELLVRSDSPTNFLVVGNTHRIFKDLMANLSAIKAQASRRILQNTKIFPKKKDKKHVAEVFARNLEFFSISIYEDLSSMIRFEATVIEENDSTIVILVGKDGEFLDTYFDEDF